MGKQSAEKVFREFITEKEGIEKLKFILDRSARIKLAERKKTTR